MIDLSWQAGLQMALTHHLAFGTDIAYTYGPLGFLNVAASGQSFMWFGGLSVVAFIYTVAARFALCLAIFTGTRRTYGASIGFLVALAVLKVGQFVDFPVLLIALIWALANLPKPRTTLAFSMAGGAVSAIELLEKISIGIACGAMVALFVMSLPADRRRNAAIAVSTFAVALVSAWLISDQPLNALPGYLHSAEQIAGGYTAAMQLPSAGWLRAAALLTAIAGVWGAWGTFDGERTRQRAGAILIWLCFCFAAFKEGFVRADSGHVPLYFAATLNGMFAFRWKAELRGIALLVAAMIACFYMAGGGNQTPLGVFRLPRSTRVAFEDGWDVLDGPKRARIIAENRLDIIHDVQVPRSTLALLRGHSVDVYPDDAVIAWAYRLNWRPLPVFQSYVAYTPWLDSLDASYVASNRAPSRILVQAGTTSIDGRVLSFDEPRTTVAIFCHYRLLGATQTYAVLGRSVSRCGTETLLKTVRAGWRQSVAVPPPPTKNSLVLVRISGIQVGGPESITSLLWEPAPRWIRLNDGTAVWVVEANADEGLPLLVSPKLDLPEPFSFVPEATSIAVYKNGVNTTAGQPITYSFYSLAIRSMRSRR
jgi:hypothetical protein